jgi:hypothetical protein
MTFKPKKDKCKILDVFSEFLTKTPSQAIDDAYNFVVENLFKIPAYRKASENLYILFSDLEEGFKDSAEFGKELVNKAIIDPIKKNKTVKWALDNPAKAAAITATATKLGIIGTAGINSWIDAATTASVFGISYLSYFVKNQNFDDVSEKFAERSSLHEKLNLTTFFLNVQSEKFQYEFGKGYNLFYDKLKEFDIFINKIEDEKVKAQFISYTDELKDTLERAKTSLENLIQKV